MEQNLKTKMAKTMKHGDNHIDDDDFRELGLEQNLKTLKTKMVKTMKHGEYPFTIHHW